MSRAFLSCGLRTGASHDWRAWRLSSQALPFLPLCRCLRQVLLHSELRNPFDQAEGDRLIKWKSQIAFLSRIAQNRLLQFRIALHRRIEADVILEGGEINQDAA